MKIVALSMILQSFVVSGQVERFLSKEDEQLILSKCVDYKSSVEYADSLSAVYEEQPFGVDLIETSYSDGRVFLITLYAKADSFEISGYCQKRIAAIKAQMRKESDAQMEVQYQKILDKAKEYREKGDLVKAKELYMRALTFRADDHVPKQAIYEIDKLLSELKKEK